MTTMIEEVGRLSLDIFWTPLALWTLLALGILLILRYAKGIPGIYQYHIRTALVLALPSSIVFSSAFHWFESLQETGSMVTTKLIVISTPLTVGASEAASQGATEFDALTFLGGFTLLSLAVTLGYCLRMAFDYVSLRSFSKGLDKSPLLSHEWLSKNNEQLAQSLPKPILTARSEAVEVPFTFGMSRPVIVLPGDLEPTDRKTMNMTIRHELMHIRHHDYLLNNIVLFVKALFWFHPLLQKLNRDITHYREIACDQEVLSDSSISRKRYAQLLLELAPKKTFKNIRPVSMAVESSTLKQRIQHMTSQNLKPNLFKTSLTVMIFSALILTGMIACTDIQDSGVTNKDIEQAQSEMADMSDKEQPLYVINGDIMQDAASKNMVSRIKTDYIKNIEVLKGEKATEEFGSKGAHGVIKIELIDKEKALEDLLPAAPDKPKTPSYDAEGEHYVVVETMPQLKGGLRGLMEKINYPEEAQEAGIEGRVIVQFIVNEQGEVENPTIVRGIGYGADQEALRVIKQAEFEPGMQNGEKVRVQYSLPIVYKLQENTQQN